MRFICGVAVLYLSSARREVSCVGCAVPCVAESVHWKCCGPVTITPVEFLPQHHAFCMVEGKKIFSEEVKWLANILAVISHLGGKGENGVILSFEKFSYLSQLKQTSYQAGETILCTFSWSGMIFLKNFHRVLKEIQRKGTDFHLLLWLSSAVSTLFPFCFYEDTALIQLKFVCLFLLDCILHFQTISLTDQCVPVLLGVSADFKSLHLGLLSNLIPVLFNASFK